MSGRVLDARPAPLSGVHRVRRANAGLVPHPDPRSSTSTKIQETPRSWQSKSSSTHGQDPCAQYRIVVADSAPRDGRAIEELGICQPMEDPSLIRIDLDRVQYWLGVGAQPTEPVQVILKVTGDWQRFKGLPGRGHASHR
jgi:ribosomal protein S16